ncbi:MAG: DUF2510 domain-containing protein [Actinomycetota bacterium]|nr:DUF2510 domain-containing protein [Actinomycetota bacterium]
MTEGQGGGTPAGWYPDPEGNGERWWNGVSWGQLREPPTGEPQQRYPDQYGQHSQQPAQAQPPGQQPQHQGQPLGQQQAQQHQPSPDQPWGQQQAQPSGTQGLRCVNCHFTDFAQSEFLLNTRGMTMFDLDAFNAAANCLICRRCGFIHWFATR